jgi:hypothetical protein
MISFAQEELSNLSKRWGEIISRWPLRQKLHEMESVVPRLLRDGFLHLVLVLVCPRQVTTSRGSGIPQAKIGSHLPSIANLSVMDAKQ